MTDQCLTCEYGRNCINGRYCLKRQHYVDRMQHEDGTCPTRLKPQ